MENIKIKRIYENAIIPTKGSEKSAGYDLYACLDEETDELSETKRGEGGFGSTGSN